jgi:hypothetical protein
LNPLDSWLFDKYVLLMALGNGEPDSQAVLEYAKSDDNLLGFTEFLEVIAAIKIEMKNHGHV